jgi:hypothetical protein
VCIRDAGPGRVALYGNADAAAGSSSAFRGRTAVHSDLALVFRRGARSFASLAGDMARRAALFRPPWVGAWLYYVLLALLLVVPPVLLGASLRRMVGARDARPGDLD